MTMQDTRERRAARETLGQMALFAIAHMQNDDPLCYSGGQVVTINEVDNGNSAAIPAADDTSAPGDS